MELLREKGNSVLMIIDPKDQEVINYFLARHHKLGEVFERVIENESYKITPVVLEAAESRKQHFSSLMKRTGIVAINKKYNNSVCTSGMMGGPIADVFWIAEASPKEIADHTRSWMLE